MVLPGGNTIALKEALDPNGSGGNAMQCTFWSPEHSIMQTIGLASSQCTLIPVGAPQCNASLLRSSPSSLARPSRQILLAVAPSGTVQALQVDPVGLRESERAWRSLVGLPPRPAADYDSESGALSSQGQEQQPGGADTQLRLSIEHKHGQGKTGTP